MKRNYDERFDNSPNSSKKYLKRKTEEQEAQEEIDEYRTNERNPDRVPPIGVKKYDRK